MGRFAKLFSTALVSMGLLTLGVGEANAYTAETFPFPEFRNTSYKFTFVRGTYASDSELRKLLADQQLNESSAISLANELRSIPVDWSYFPNAGSGFVVSPLFFYGVNGSQLSAAYIQSETNSVVSSGSGSAFSITFDTSSERVFAIASPVPEIDGALLPQAALIAAGLFAWSRRRRVGVSAG
jgi:hypothetical protein